MILSRMASARVGSPIRSCQRSTGIWLVMRVAPRPWRSSTISEHVVSLLGPEGVRAPNRRGSAWLDAAERTHQPRVSPVATGEREIAEHSGNALIKHRAIVAAGLLSEGASQPTLADTGRPFDDQVLCLLDPAPGDQRLEQCAVEATRAR